MKKQIDTAQQVASIICRKMDMLLPAGQTGFSKRQVMNNLKEACYLAIIAIMKGEES